MAWMNKALGWSDEDVSAMNFSLSGTQLNGAVTLKDGTQKTASVTLSPAAVGLPMPTALYAGNALIVNSAGTGYVFGESPVTSVNGQSGAVTITKSDLGLARLTAARQMPLSESVDAGADLNELIDTGCYWTRGMASAAMSNAPTSADNTGASDRDWIVIVQNPGDTDACITQMAISLRADCAVRLRNRTGTSWTAWKTLM